MTRVKLKVHSPSQDFRAWFLSQTDIRKVSAFICHSNGMNFEKK